jgi:hypothetical protein
MSTTYQCGDHAALVSYLYDECGPDERAAIGAHVAVCVACAAEMAALQSTRVQLASWSPPEAELGFAIVRPQASGPRPQGSLGSEARGLRPGAFWRPAVWLGRPLPAWAQLAAAAVIFAAGLSLGIAGGTMGETPSQVANAAAPVTASVPAARVTAASLDALEQRLRDEMAQLRLSSADPTAAQGPADVQLLARVRALIDESERRQQRELALRTAQIVRDFDSQRRVDLEQIQRNFGQIEGLTNAEVREQRQMLNYLMRVSQPQ